jgi:two-component system, NtrC family, sensor kinase
LKKGFIIVICLGGTFMLRAQQLDVIDRLKHRLSIVSDENTRISTLDSLTMYYFFFSYKADSVSFYGKEFINYAITLENKRPLILAYARMGFYYVNTGQLTSSLDISLKGIRLSEEYHIPDYLSALYQNIAWVYMNLDDDTSALKSCLEGIRYLPFNKDSVVDQRLHLNGQLLTMYANNTSDSAYYYSRMVDSLASVSSELAAREFASFFIIQFYLKKNNYPVADSLIAAGILSCEKKGSVLLSDMLTYKAVSLLKQNKAHHALDAAYRLMKLSENYGVRATYYSGMLLRDCYRQLGNIDSAYHYYIVSDSLRTEVDKIGSAEQIEHLKFNEQLGTKEKEANLVLQNEKTTGRITLYVFLTAFLASLIISYIQWRNNRQRKRINIHLQEQKDKVESTLTELKSTQALLVQSEKIASLGQLTAGIAHEIQNPLNFVNNFSEISSELVDELYEEKKKTGATRNGELEAGILNVLKQNLEKINHHGKRADAIVKSMLLHSQARTGKRERINLNALVEEYMRLAYHGFKAKENAFNATLRTDFDDSVGEISVVKQDIGRVLLNLYNNAFYALNAKMKQQNGIYEPTVSVTTKKSNNELHISVKDNGLGIQEELVTKIFEPFFTTKPTGQGTGLGLSLSYDIVKAHGGELKVASEEGEWTVFVIQLPLV